MLSLVLLAAAGLAVRAQTPAPGTHDVTGRVVDARTNAPIADAVVTLTGHGAPDRVLTDTSGRFTFAHLPAGAFGVSASKPGFSGGGLAQRTPSDLASPFAVSDGDRATDVTLKLWRLGAISGVVTNDAGEPLANVQVQTLHRGLVAGRQQWLLGPSVTTDDRGRYRVSGLETGAYLVAARPDLDVETPLLLALLSANPASAADIMAGVVAANRGPDVDAGVEHDAPAFYAASGARATPIDVAGDRAGIDLHLARVRTVRVSGRVTGRAEVMESIEGLVVRLVPADATSRAPVAEFEFVSAACDDAGRFEFSAVPPGRYVMEAIRVAAPSPGSPANPPLPASPTLWGISPLVVRAGAAMSDVALRVETGRIVSGRIDREGSSVDAPMDVSTIALRLDAAEAPMAGAPATWTGRATADGRFAMADAPPGRYFLRVTNLPRGLTLHSATIKNRDVLDEPFTIADADVPDVTITLDTIPLGAINGHADPHATVVVFAQQASLRVDTSAQARRTRRVRPSPDGTFTIGGLPAGEYLTVAVAGTLPADWQAPLRLQALATRASRVRVTDGVTAAIDPVVIK